MAKVLSLISSHTFKSGLSCSAKHIQNFNIFQRSLSLNFYLSKKFAYEDAGDNYENENLGRIVTLSVEDVTPVKKVKNPINSETPTTSKILQKLPEYEKLDRNSRLLSRYLTEVKSKKRRHKTGRVLLEGKRLIQDALAAGVKPEIIFFSRPIDIENLSIPTDCKLYKTPYKTIQLWSDVNTSQGVLGIFPVPDVTQYRSTSKIPLTVICDNVRDPGNLGTILRTASAVGCEQVILTKGCVDLWEPKVLRSAAGTHFRLKIHHSIPWEDVSTLLPESSAIFLADSNVPQPEKVEEKLQEYELTESGEKVMIEDDTKRVTPFQKRSVTESSLPLTLYLNADYNTSESVILVLGGETEGLSSEAFALGKVFNGTRVYIPLENGVESLNSGTAFGILTFEIVRQRLYEGSVNLTENV